MEKYFGMFLFLIPFFSNLFAGLKIMRIFATANRSDGGIGRRAGLKHQWGNPSRFDPGSEYYSLSINID